MERKNNENREPYKKVRVLFVKEYVEITFVDRLTILPISVYPHFVKHHD